LHCTDDGLDRDISKSKVQSALRRGADRLCSTKCSTDRSSRRRQAIDVRNLACIGSLARSAAYYANLRGCAPSDEGGVWSRLSIWLSCEYRAVVVTARCLGSAEFEELSGGSLRLSSQKNARGQSSPALNLLNDVYATAASGAKRPFAKTLMSALCRFCSLIPGLGVKLSNDILAGPTVLSAVGADPPHDGVR
jgi:hypothetical protein